MVRARQENSQEIVKKERPVLARRRDEEGQRDVARGETKDSAQTQARTEKTSPHQKDQGRGTVRAIKCFFEHRMHKWGALKNTLLFFLCFSAHSEDFADGNEQTFDFLALRA